jgi:pilus assembly protein CpaE
MTGPKLPKLVKTEPFYAFLSDETSRQAVREMIAEKEWPEDSLKKGVIKEAAEYLKENLSPGLLLVEVSSAEAAAKELDALAEVCDPKTKVLVTGKVDEFSFYQWLMDIGIAGYVLQPFDKAKLDEVIGKIHIATEEAHSGEQAKITAIVGARGGVGASTLAVNLSWWLSHHYDEHVALLDLDFHTGTSALALDIEASRGLREALEKPDRIDELFLDRVMAKLENLSVLGGEEPLTQNIDLKPETADVLISKITYDYDRLVLDLPLNLNPFIVQSLQHVDELWVVTEPSLAGLRDGLRLKDAMHELQLPEPHFVISKVGQEKKYEMPKAEFEKGLESKVKIALPYESLCHRASLEGQLIAEMNPKSKWVIAMNKLAVALQEEDAESEEKPRVMGWLRK